MVEQVLKLHPDITHLHIGADEVWNIGDSALWARIEKKLRKNSHLIFHFPTSLGVSEVNK